MKRSDYIFLIFIALLLFIFFAASGVFAQGSIVAVSPLGDTLSTSNGDGVVYSWTGDIQSSYWLYVEGGDFQWGATLTDSICDGSGNCSWFDDVFLEDGFYSWTICYDDTASVCDGSVFTVVNAPTASTFPIDAVVAVCAFTILLWWIPKSEVRLLPALCAFIFQPYWVEAAFVAFVTSLVLGTFLFLADLADGLSEEKR
jgi:hypothetical protein